MSIGYWPKILKPAATVNADAFRYNRTGCEPQGGWDTRMMPIGVLMQKKALISVVVMLLLTMLGDFLVHGTLLQGSYSALAQLYRTPQDQQTYFLHMLLAHLFIAVGMVWVYLEGRKDAPWLMQGVRFGMALAVLMIFPGYLIYYAVQPLPPELVAAQITGDFITRLVASVALAWINR